MNSGLAFAIVLGLAALAGNWFWNKQSRRDHLERVLNRAQTSEILTNHSSVFKKGVIKVTDTVYSAVGYALANSLMIIGKDGVVIVDVTESMVSATEILAEFRKITDKPIKAIIYTHNHADHTYGARGFIENEKHPPEIWAHESLISELHTVFRTSGIGGQRAMRQFGVFIPQRINAGIGFNLRVLEDKGQSGLIFPNRLFPGKEKDITVAGVPMKLVHIPGETPDQIGVWLPDQKVFLCADDLYRAFPNLYAIRGTPTRSLLDWVSSLEKIIDLKPKFLVPSHTRPLEGEETIRDLLSIYRDAIQFIHDQTVRYMNKGLMPDEVVTKVHLPNHVAAHPYLIEFYGTVEWSVKGVFNGYLGWFSGDPVDLSPLTPDELAKKYVQLGGGVEKCIIEAEEAINNKEYRWALTLASHVIRVDQDNRKAREVASSSMMALGGQQTSSNGRNYFFTSSLEVIGELDTHVATSTRKDSFVRIMPISTLFNLLPIRFMPEECSDKNTTILFEFTDSKTFITLIIRNSVAIVRVSSTNTYQIKVTTTEDIWREMMISKMAALTSYAKGEFVVEGGLMAFRSAMACFERS